MDDNQKELKRQRDKAIYSSTNAAKQLWREEAYATVQILARKKQPFTTDDVLRILEQRDITTRENRALGGIMLKANKDEVIRSIGHRNSTRRCTHARLKTLWIGRTV